MDNLPRMNTPALHDRIRQRLAETRLSSRQASIDSGLSEDAISKLLRKPDQSQTLMTVQKLARGLNTSPAWLAYGIEVAERCEEFKPSPQTICLDRGLLRQAIEFVLLAEGVEAARAAIVADILPAALEGSPIGEVQNDPLRSFRVHFQLGSEHRSQPPSDPR